MAGLMSGLTLGLMSLDMVELEVLKRSGSPDERIWADRIMPVVKHHHLLLVTLLLCNALASEALPLFIDRLADPVTAIVLSVSVVLVFGEIIPQAICSRYGLQVGAYSAGFVQVLMFLCSPIAWPISKLIDTVLGDEHSALFRRSQLKALVDIHSADAGFGGSLNADEIHIIRGALDLTHKTAVSSMTPLDKTLMLSTDDVLDERVIQSLLVSGHSRVPVFRGGNRRDILGLLLVKELVLVNPLDHLPVGALRLRELPRLEGETPMYDLLRLFETGKSHMVLLTAVPEPVGSRAAHVGRRTGSMMMQTAISRRHGLYDAYEDSAPSEPQPVGIITIEDVIEELLQEEIIDETDQYVDNLQAVRVIGSAPASSLPPRLKQALTAGMFTPRVGRLGSLRQPVGGPGMSGRYPGLGASSDGLRESAAAPDDPTQPSPHGSFANKAADDSSLVDGPQAHWTSHGLLHGALTHGSTPSLQEDSDLAPSDAEVVEKMCKDLLED
ncbi:MAG: hypothetical protein WDW38_002892 [Sanguina aurantia]